MGYRVVLILALLLGAITPEAGRADSGEDVSRQEWIATDDPLVTMHAEVVRSSDVGWDDEQPVILVATPYGNHAGQNDWDPFRPAEHNGRFSDFLALSDALDRGYTYVVVDLPGFGGSSGCSDLGGPLERAAVKRAVEWAANQPWSTGAVALLGKSYDAWTGLMGIAERPAGLDAVIALEPVYSPYTVDFANGVRNLRSFVMPVLYAEIDAYPGTTADSPEYQANALSRPQCFAVNQANWMNDDGSAAFWRERDLPSDSVGATTPLFMTQGFLETNTVSRGAFSYFNSLGNPDNRAWFGQFDHIRAWEPDRRSGRTASGLYGFVDQVMRFLDLHLRGIAPAVDDPLVSVQDNFGRYRAEATWPPPDAGSFVTELRTGTYLDNAGLNTDPASDGIWSVSQPLPHDVWLTGEPVVTAEIKTLSPRANVAVRVLDVDPSASYGVEVSRDAYLVRDNGHTTVEFPLMGQDWVFEQGHRIAVQVAGANNRWFAHVPTGGEVAVADAHIALPLLTMGRTDFLGGHRTRRLIEETNDWDWVSVTPSVTVEFTLSEPIDTGSR